MNKIFVESIYRTLVEENKVIYYNLFSDTKFDEVTDEYWKDSLTFYRNLSQKNKETMINIIEQTIIDTISNMLGVIDGSSNLDGCDFELKLLLNNIDTENELQDLFLEYVEDNRENKE